MLLGPGQRQISLADREEGPERAGTTENQGSRRTSVAFQLGGPHIDDLVVAALFEGPLEQPWPALEGKVVRGSFEFG
jgi:hypothetical protein